MTEFLGRERYALMVATGSLPLGFSTGAGTRANYQPTRVMAGREGAMSASRPRKPPPAQSSTAYSASETSLRPNFAPPCGEGQGGGD